MKTIYILLTRSGTLLSKLVYAVTGASYTHASMAFDEELNCLYSSTRKNGYTMKPIEDFSVQESGGLIARVGGTMESFHFAFGGTDVIRGPRTQADQDARG